MILKILVNSLSSELIITTCSFSVLETDYIKNKIEGVFIGAPLVQLQELSEFADYDDSESGDRKNQPTFRKKKGRRKLYISIARTFRPQGIFGKWVDPIFLSCTGQFGSSLTSIYLDGCARINDKIIIESTHNIEKLKVCLYTSRIHQCIQQFCIQHIFKIHF